MRNNTEKNVAFDLVLQKKPQLFLKEQEDNQPLRKSQSFRQLIQEASDQQQPPFAAIDATSELKTANRLSTLPDQNPRHFHLLLDTETGLDQTANST